MSKAATVPDSWRATNTRLVRALARGELPPELLVVGPAGTGKTFGILDLLHVLCRDNRGLRVLVARATRAALTESVLVAYETEILPIDGMERLARGVSRRVRQSYRYPNGSEIVLGGLDNPSRLLSTPWDIVYVNEAIEATQDAWETILSRLARPGRSTRFGYLLADANPGDPSHWLRARIDRDGLLSEWVTPHQANPAMWDGTAWTTAGERYLESLRRSLTGTRRRRLLDGLWAAGEGAWFGETFDPAVHVSTLAEYDPAHPVHLAVDTGVHVGAVLFQVVGEGPESRVRVFGDYYAQGLAAGEAAREILALAARLCGGRVDVGRADPAGGAATGLGTTHLAEYERAGLRLQPWLRFPGCVLSGLNLVESFLGGEPPGLLVHPRCERLVAALGNYMRARRGGQWVDAPEDPQHPHEDVMDALRSGLLDRFPEGRRPMPRLRRVRAGRVL